MAALMMANVTASAQLNDSISMDTTVWYNQIQQLDEVVVKSRLPKTKLKGNSLVTRIKGSVLAQSGRATNWKCWARVHLYFILMAARCTTKKN